MEQLADIEIDSNVKLLTTSVFWLEEVKDDKLISADTFCAAVTMQDMLRRADGGEWAESLRDIDLPDAAGLATQKKRARTYDTQDESRQKRFRQSHAFVRTHALLFQRFASCTRKFHQFSFISFVSSPIMSRN